MAGFNEIATVVPPVGAGRSSSTVKVVIPPTFTVAAGGVIVTMVGTSAAPSTRTSAVFIELFKDAVSVTAAAWVNPLTNTWPVLWPAGIVMPPPLTVSAAAFDEVIVTVVFVGAGPLSVTVSAVGIVGDITWPTRINEVAGVKFSNVTAPPTKSAALRGSSFGTIWR